MKNARLSRCIAAALLVAVAGCRAKNEVTVTGRVAAPAAASSRAPSVQAVAASGTPDRLEAFPLEKGLIMSYGLGDLRSASLGADGTFSLTLPADRDWMLVLVDSSASGPARFQGYVAATVGPGDTLLTLPLDGAAAETVALGTVSKAAGSDTYDSSGTVAASDFSLTPAGLQALARTDAAFKTLRNLLVNRVGDTYTMVTPQFSFEPDLGAGGSPQPAGAFGDPGDYALVYFWGLQLDTNAPVLSMDALCGAAPPTLALTLPTAEVRTSEGSTCTGLGAGRIATGPTFYASNPGAGTSAFDSHLSFGFGSFTGPVVAGDWTLTTGGATQAVFDVAIASPTDAVGRPTGLVPVVRANTDATHRVTSFDVRWYAPDAAGGWVEVVDPGVFGHALRHVGFDVRGPGESRLEQLQFDPATTSTLVPSQAWFVGGGDPTLRVDRVGFYLANGGVGRWFYAVFP